MSLPRELLDELLSGYMDGELSADEHARVEQMLAVDAAVRESLRQLQQQSQTVRDSLRSASPLDADFAERVLAASFAEAERQGLDESHPLRRAARETSSPRPRRPSERSTGGLPRRRPRTLVGALAIAAGLALAAIFLSGPEGDPVVATLDVERQNEAVANAPGDQLGGPAGEGQSLEQAGDTRGLANTSPAPETDPGAQPPSDRIAASTTPAPSPRDVTIGSESGGDSLPSDAAPRMIPEPSATEAPPLSPSADQIALRAVLVYEVNLTPLGRERNVVNRAFREAGIRSAYQRTIDEDLVGYLRRGGMIGGADEGIRDDEPGVSVMFLEGSGRRLEKLMMTLLMAEEEVESVGFSLAMEPPVMAAIDSLRKVDATTIRSDAMSLVAQSLSAEEGSGVESTFTAGDRTFLPLQRESLGSLSALSSLSDGDQPDITAMTFLIIRSPQ